MRRNSKVLGKVVIPALIVFVMVLGAFGTVVVPRTSPAAAGASHATPSTRAAVSSTLSQGPSAGDSTSGVSGDVVSSEVTTNEAIRGRTDIRPEPLMMQYDSVSGRAWNEAGQPLTLPDAAVPKSHAVSFTSRVAPRTTVLESDPEPTSLGVDAGGPYGGPDTYEGDTIHFVATVDDPSLVLFRWDFNGDGKWETGTKAGGYWTSNAEVDYQYLDMYSGQVCVEAWDGFSTKTVQYTGWLLDQPSNPTWWNLIDYYTYTVGYMFTAKMTMTVNTLAFFRYSDGVEYGKWATLWDADSQAKLAECEPGPGAYMWTTCTLPSPLTLYLGQSYVLSNTIYATDFYWWYTLGIDKPSDTDQAAFGAAYYTYGYSEPAFPAYYYYDGMVFMVDFYYSYDVVFPLTVSDCAACEVNNIAPTVFDLSVSPMEVQEGNPAEFSAMFYDPGLEEKWQYRWCWGDGTCDDWGGIRVGSGLSRLSNILVYSDVAPHYATQALDYFGVSYTFSTDLYAMPALFASRQWDLIIWQDYYLVWTAATTEDALMAQIQGGALVVYNDWAISLHYPHPLFSYFGGEWQSDLFTPLPMYAWEPTSDLFNTPSHPPLVLNPTHDQYYRDGQRLKVMSNAFDPLGYTDYRQVNQASMVVRNDLTTIWNGFTPQNYEGDEDYDGDPDMLELLVNEVRLLTGPEVPPTMPWPVPPTKHTYRDDDPISGTPSDMVTATLEVKDSNDGKLKGGSFDDLTDFERGNPWPTGWSETEGFAWNREYSGYVNPTQAAVYWYYSDYDGYIHTLESRAYDLSLVDMSAPMVRMSLSYDHYWWADYSQYDPSAYQDGYVEVSVDNFATYDVIAEYHDMDPATDQGTRTFDIAQYAGASNFKARFTVQGYNDWLWHVDNVYVFAEWGVLVYGLGSGDIPVQVNNVPPEVYGGPESGLVGESEPFDFTGYKIQDPTLWDPATGEWGPVSTEWFAYQWNLDDGTTSDWMYTGTLELPKLKVLVLGTFLSGGEGFFSFLRGIDVVDQVDTVDFLYMNPGDLPTVSDMLGYDVVLFFTNYGTYSSSYDLCRQVIGDNLADYLDLGGGGVITLMATYDFSSGYGDLFELFGRYVDEEYGAFREATYLYAPASLGEVYQPDHPVMQGVRRVTSDYIHSGDYELTDGAELLADWDDGNSAIGVKELDNGGRSVNIGSFAWGSEGSNTAGDAQKLMKNAIVWASHATVPTNDIPSFTHVFGDNGIYYVDLAMVDDDMGWEWDADNNELVAIPDLEQTMTHITIPVEVYNVDPIVDRSSMEAYIAADVCLRVSGSEWNTVSLDFFTDGELSGGTSVTRMPGGPNDQAKCTFAKIDVLRPHTFSTQVDFHPMQGATSGSNPVWVIIAPWKDPLSPGHGTVTYKNEFKVEDPTHYTWTLDMPTLKMGLVDSGQGAPIEFAATALDTGTDDLAFVWIWDDGTPDTVTIHHNADGTATAGTNDDPWYMGFSEPFFDREANDERSPYGTTYFEGRDYASHHFSEVRLRMWVALLVLDDDNTRGYPSHFGHDGTDMEFFIVDLT